MPSRDGQDYGNKFAVIKKEGGVMIARTVPENMGMMDALILAAWIVRLVDKNGEVFAEVLRQVRGRSSS